MFQAGRTFLAQAFTLNTSVAKNLIVFKICSFYIMNKNHTSSGKKTFYAEVNCLALTFINFYELILLNTFFEPQAG